MILEEQVSLRQLTTLRTGGTGAYLASCQSIEDIQEAISFAHTHKRPWRVLGAGSNMLASDEGYDGVVIRIDMPSITVESVGKHTRLISGAGALWEDVVAAALREGLWGIENLAGIPGTVGAAPIQNIGAYGCELEGTLEYVDAYDVQEGRIMRLKNDACAFGYRDSRFKREPHLIITRVSLLLALEGKANTSYPDVARIEAQGADLSTPEAVGRAIRDIRSRKFPDMSSVGTAGSFFKNPIISKQEYDILTEHYPDVPGFPYKERVKIPLAFILDRILGLKGFSVGGARLFEVQPLVIVVEAGGTACDVETLARIVTERVYEKTNIHIEREVQTL